MSDQPSGTSGQNQAYDELIQSLAGKLSYAIAHAEGYFAHGSLPGRINNPGDMELGDKGWGVDNGKTIYASATEGWNALRRECTAILTGASHVYSVSDTIADVARKWTGGDNDGAWAAIVAEKLSLYPDTVMKDWIKAAQASALPMEGTHGPII